VGSRRPWPLADAFRQGRALLFKLLVKTGLLQQFEGLDAGGHGQGLPDSVPAW